jgi:hypothetical protein
VRRRAIVAALALGACAACNGILGIDAPTLVAGDGGDATASRREAGSEGGRRRDANGTDGSRHDASGEAGHHDGGDGGQDATTRDAGQDATMREAAADSRHDAARDATADSRHDARDAGAGESGPDALVDTGVDAPIDAGPPFDGYCSCDDDAGCQPIVVARVGSGNVTGLVLADGGMYFTLTVFGGGYVGFAGFDHTTRTLVADAGTVVGMAVRGRSIYWLNGSGSTLDTCSMAACAPASLAFFAAITGAYPLSTTSAVYPLVATNAGGVFWSDLGGDHVCPYDGGCKRLDADSPPTLPGTNTHVPQSIAVVDAGAYWTLEGGGIASCPLADCLDAPTTVLASDGGPNLNDLVAAGATLYWVAPRDAGAELWTCSTASCGETATVLLTSGNAISVTDLTASEDGLYWLDPTNARVVGLKLVDGAAPVTLAADAGVVRGQATALAVGPTCVFWSANESDGTVAIQAVAK